MASEFAGFRTFSKGNETREFHAIKYVIVTLKSFIEFEIYCESMSTHNDVMTFDI
jgi:hypothetical protein